MAKTASSKSSSPETGAYRRRKGPVRVRRWIFDWRNWPWRPLLFTLAFVAVAAGSAYAVDQYVAQGPRFRFEPGGLVITGLDRVDEGRIQAVFADDFGKSLLDPPLEARRMATLAVPWVADASVVRLWPNRIWVDIQERRPLAFVRVPAKGGTLELRMIDDRGVFLDPLAGEQFDLPVIDGVDPAASREDREARVRLFERLVRDLDAEEPHYSERISQINVADDGNARVTVVDGGEVIELQMGDKLFRHRFEVYLEYIDSWKRQFGKVGWVDLRIRDQVVILPYADARRGAGPVQP
ncbi:MAG: FtsQ-type POTRA domain-containing protein [Acidobacteria bacterium]|nr:FtsQ-type POTRA domain-containing protein [Acidobacteriota bacterium]